VRNRGSGEAYVLTPGPNDGKADAAFGVGDFWALRRRAGQIDDGQGFTTDHALARARIDGFVNHESIVGTDVVVWYAAHFAHDAGHQHDDDEGGHIVGPTLAPQEW
jgi:hypothetical protein